jgi:hypothetical protein
MSAEEYAGREKARQIEAENPLWLVVFGVYSHEFVCYPRFGLDGGSIVAAKNPDALPPRLRRVERSVLNPPSPDAG